MQEQITQDIKVIKDNLLTDLALERTILAKQRTTLAEISVFLSTIGVGLLMFKFFDFIAIKLIGITISLVAVYIITKLFHSYKKFQKRIKKIDKRNNYFH